MLPSGEGPLLDSPNSSNFEGHCKGASALSDPPRVWSEGPTMKREMERATLTPPNSDVGRARTFLSLFLGRSDHSYRQGLGFWRLCAVVAGFAPLFVLLAVRGNSVIPGAWYVSICLVLAVLPMVFLVLRFFVAYRYTAPRQIQVGTVENSNSHTLGYLFATLLPFYRQELATAWDLAAIVIALAFIIFLFWHLNLHYLNIFLAVFRYRAYTVYPPDDGNPFTSRVPVVVLTRRHYLAPGNVIQGYRLSDTLYWGLEH